MQLLSFVYKQFFNLKYTLQYAGQKLHPHTFYEIFCI